MELRRIRYAVALLCLVMTVSLMTYKLTLEPTDTISTTSQTWTTIQQDNEPSPVQSGTQITPTTRTALSTTLSQSTGDHRRVSQWSNPYLLIDEYYLIPLSTSVYSGVRTGVVKLSQTPLIVYYRYELPTGQWYTFMYDFTTNSSREMGQLTMIGTVSTIPLFSLKEADSYRGISALIDGQLQTLYTGTYTSAQYLWDTLKLNNNQEIYLPLRSWWF